MTGSGTLTLTGTITGFSSGSRTVNVPWVFPAAVESTYSYFLGVGTTQISVPGGSSMVMIEPPESNPVPIFLAASPTDIGIALHRTLPHWQSLDGSVSILYLTITILLPGPVQITFY